MARDEAFAVNTVQLREPSGLGSAFSSEWVSLKDYEIASFLVVKGPGQSGDDTTISVEAATSSSGANATAMTPRALVKSANNLNNDVNWSETAMPYAAAGQREVILRVPLSAADVKQLGPAYRFARLRATAANARVELAVVVDMQFPRHVVSPVDLPSPT